MTDHPRFVPVRGTPDTAYQDYHGAPLVELVLRLSARRRSVAPVIFAAAFALLAIATPVRANGSAWLGIWIGAETPQLSGFERSQKQIIYIVSVDHGGPAEAAGLLPSDVILQIDGQPVRSMRQVICLVRAARPGQTVLLAIQRQVETRAIPATLAEWPKDEPVDADCPPRTS